MRSLEFISELAAKTGFDHRNLQTIDVRLRAAGLRAGRVGGSVPDVTLAEALKTTIAIATHRKAKDAAKVVKDVCQFKFTAIEIDKGDPPDDATFLTAFGCDRTALEGMLFFEAIAVTAMHLTGPGGTKQQV